MDVSAARGTGFAFTASMSLAVWPEDGDDWKRLVEDSYGLLTRAWREGGDRLYRIQPARKANEASIGARGEHPRLHRGLPLFRDMSGLEVNAVSAFLEPRRYSKGSVVFREGESGKELFIVRYGRVGSYVTQPDGTRRDVYEFTPGVLFGEMAIIEERAEVGDLLREGGHGAPRARRHRLLSPRVGAPRDRRQTPVVDGPRHDRLARRGLGLPRRPRALGRGRAPPRGHRRALGALQPPIPRGDDEHALRARRRLLAALLPPHARHRPFPRHQRRVRGPGRRRRDRGGRNRLRSR